MRNLAGGRALADSDVLHAAYAEVDCPWHGGARQLCESYGAAEKFFIPRIYFKFPDVAQYRQIHGSASPRPVALNTEHVLEHQDNADLDMYCKGSRAASKL